MSEPGGDRSFDEVRERMASFKAEWGDLIATRNFWIRRSDNVGGYDVRALAAGERPAEPEYMPIRTPEIAVLADLGFAMEVAALSFLLPIANDPERLLDFHGILAKQWPQIVERSLDSAMKVAQQMAANGLAEQGEAKDG